MIPFRKGEELRRLAPGARLVTFPGAGHGVTLGETEAVNRLLLDHFRETEGRDTASRHERRAGPIEARLAAGSEELNQVVDGHASLSENGA
jgi:hypothetical protein